MSEVAEIAHSATEQRLHACREVAGVEDRADQVQRQPSLPGSQDGQVGALLGHDPARPQDGPPTWPRPPPGQIDTIADNPDLRYRVPPGQRGVSAHRGEDHRARTRLDGRLQPGRGRRVQGADHPDPQQARHRNGQVVQAVVVDHVEGSPALFGDVDHQLQVGMVLLEPPLGWHADIGACVGADPRLAATM